MRYYSPSTKLHSTNKYSRWYNIPVESSSKSTPVASVIPALSENGDSQPINFDTFVPTHNPALDHLSSLAPPMDYAQDTSGAPMVSQDEAFSHALNAMYWGGYWTAMYHVWIFLHLLYLTFNPCIILLSLQCQRNLSKMNTPSAEDDQTDENDKDHFSGEEDEDFIPTQR